MTDENPEIARKLAELKATYISQLGERVGNLNTALAGLSADSEFGLQETSIEDLRFHAHKLSGTAGTFGFPELGNAGATIEQICEGLIVAKSAPSQEQVTELQALVKQCLSLAGL